MNNLSILGGIDAIFDRWLAVPPKGRPPHYYHRSAALALSGDSQPARDPLVLVTEAMRVIERNWTASRLSYGKPPSRQNWRFERRLAIAEANDSPEVQLERALAAALGDEWANQVPTASGLTGPHNDRHRHIDLVHRSAPGVYTFYELKVASNTPLYAAMELLVRGLLYIFTCQHLAALGYDPSTKELLRAQAIRLRVLAPAAFYTGLDFSWLATSLTQGLMQYLATVPDLALTMDLAFEAFPFPITPTDTTERLRNALTGLLPIYD
ncbi:MAG TPA: hypothetical protein VFU22_04950 [Roseiflexaceae bacterium]|nr:hypothetical protein [Roseiflexaceae bacterium]